VAGVVVAMLSGGAALARDREPAMQSGDADAPPKGSGAIVGGISLGRTGGRARMPRSRSR
jgi:hypothetical protein